MRQTTRARLSFFCVAILLCASAFWLLPASLISTGDFVVTALYGGLLFIAMPALYAYLVIYKGKQAKWKILLSFSLAALVARYAFPPEIANYFEFIAYIRYPLAAVLILLEFILMGHVIKSIWQARHLKGDPRVHAAAKAEKTEGRQKEMTVLMAYEPASWYYSLPWLSRQHPTALTRLNLRSARLWHFIISLTVLIAASAVAYWSLTFVSDIAAIVVASLILWGVVYVVANFRVSRSFSLYQLDSTLVVNASYFTLYCIDVANIREVEIAQWPEEEYEDAPVAGRGIPNVKLSFHDAITEYSMMATMTEKVDTLYLVVEKPEVLAKLAPEEVIRLRA